jgi:PAS domain-containing protein
VVDANWCLRLVNRRYEALSQLTREQSLGKSLWTLFPEAAEPSSPFHQHLQRAMRERAEVVFEAYYAPLQSWASTTAYPAPGGGLVILSIATLRLSGRRSWRITRRRHTPASWSIGHGQPSADSP